MPQQAEKIAREIIYAVTAILLFILVKIALSVVITLLGFVANLPILKQFNEVGGLAYGILRGIIIVFVIAVIMGVVAKINPESSINENMQNSFITKNIYEKIIKI